MATQVKGAWLGWIALALILIAVLGFAMASPGDQTPAFVGIVAIVILLQLPAVIYRKRGGSVVVTWLLAFLVPFLLFEALLAIGAAQHGNLGGDLQGIEYDLMTYVVPPLVAVSATIVTMLAIVYFPRERDGY